MTLSPRRTIELAGSSIWMASTGALFTILALAFIATPAAIVGILVVAAALAAILSADIRVIRRTRRLVVPLPAPSLDEASRLKRFRWVFAAEAVAMCAGAVIFGITKHYDFITPFAVFVVGLHFFPLAAMFDAPRHYVTGAVFCGAVAATVFLVPASARIGSAPTWFVMISLCCGPTALLSAVGSAAEAAKAGLTVSAPA
jgi:hypothetical protein